MIADPTTIERAAAYINDHMGEPWAKGAVGPHVWCCWGWAQAVERDVFGREIAMVSVDEDSRYSIARAMRNHPLFKVWVTDASPQHGDVVKMFQPSDPNHVGVYLDIDGGGVTHCSRDDGVRFDRLFNLAVMGLRPLEFWRPKVTL